MGATLAATAGMMHPVIRYACHKIKLPLPAKVAIPMEAAKKMPLNSAEYFSYGWMPAILVRNPDGAFTAFNATCTHLDCTVTYEPDQKGFLCNCHMGTFDINGTNTGGPPPRPMEQLDIKIEDGRLMISRKTDKESEAQDHAKT